MEKSFIIHYYWFDEELNSHCGLRPKVLVGWFGLSFKYRFYTAENPITRVICVDSIQLDAITDALDRKVLLNRPVHSPNPYPNLPPSLTIHTRHFHCPHHPVDWIQV